MDELLGGVSDERFALLVNLSKKITDFNPAEDETRENVSTYYISKLFERKFFKEIKTHFIVLPFF